ncbi:MAG: phosphate signaling complex protein PhoU [Verrucomicrobia bacterium]|nr:phosphate signaling complex protein PhoU [Verrucomicrobiota bacterium]
MTKHFQHEIDRLKKAVLGLCARVEESVRLAVQAVEERDDKKGRQVIAADDRIDAAEVEIEEECLKILALHQPVAIDLRFVVAVLKLNNDLERMADLAVNMAERAIYLSSHDLPPIQTEFHAMAVKAQEMVRQSIDALMSMDGELARKVCASDDEVDALNRAIYDEIKRAIGAHPAHINALIQLLSASRHVERIADHATNIAEDIIYMIDGEIVRHQGEQARK